MKRKIIIGSSLIVSILIISLIMCFILQKDESDDTVTLVPLQEALESFDSSIKEAKYENMVIYDFDVSLEQVQSMYNLKIMTDDTYLERTFLENFSIMKEIIDKFFMEDFDKSHIEADFMISADETEYVSFYDIEKQCGDEKYNAERPDFLFGNNTSQGGYMVQIDESLRYT